MKIDVELRALIRKDRGMVASSWLKSYARTRDARRVSAKIYYVEQARVIDRLLDSAETIIAANPEDTHQIFGWVCGTRATLETAAVIHYAYVKDVFRRKGVGRTLVTAMSGGAPVEFTHLPPVDGRDEKSFPDVETLLTKLAPFSQFNPYLLLAGVGEGAGEGRGHG